MASPFTLSRDELLPLLPESLRELWPHQKKPIERIAEHFRTGATMVVLDAPPGAGKSLIAEMVRRELRVQALYLCQTKVLQDQLARTFPYARVIKGRENYPTADDFARSAKECDAWRKSCKADRGCQPSGDFPHCSFCHPLSVCPYTVAKTAALRSPLAVANTSYAFLEWGAQGMFKNWELAILDEWDEVEGVLFNTLNVAITYRELARFRIRPPTKAVDAPWTVDAQARVAQVYDELRGNPPDDYPKIGELASQLRLAAAGLQDKSWIVLSQSMEDGIQIGPIEVGALGQKYLWPHAKRWLLMSGTAIDARLRLKKLGWTDFGTTQRPGKSRVLRLPSVYPVENRPVRVWPVGSMVSKQREASLPKVADAIRQILDHHATERVLIHTGTYAINTWLTQALSPRYSERISTFTASRDRQAAIDRFLTMPGGVLMGPAMERGLDLPDDACRAVVICRVAYPFKGDPRVAARSLEGGTWWMLQAIETIATLVQMTGRGMRHMDDFCVAYILDSQFKKIQQHGLYANRWPTWWKESLVDFTGWQ